MDNQAVLSSSNKKKLEDGKFTADVQSAAFINHLFVRLVAKERHFSRVDFRYSTFDACYLRNCTFDSCDFTGCRFVGTNLHGSSFSGCKFEYASFEKTDIDNEVLSSGCPGSENLKMRFARSLRMNYQQLGDADSANKAIGVELDATSYPDSHHLSWMFGISMIIWAPLALIIAVFVALSFLCIFWPRRKVTIGEIAVRLPIGISIDTPESTYLRHRVRR